MESATQPASPKGISVPSEHERRSRTNLPPVSRLSALPKDYDQIAASSPYTPYAKTTSGLQIGFHKFGDASPTEALANVGLYPQTPLPKTTYPSSTPSIVSPSVPQVNLSGSRKYSPNILIQTVSPYANEFLKFLWGGDPKSEDFKTTSMKWWATAEHLNTRTIVKSLDGFPNDKQFFFPTAFNIDESKLGNDQIESSVTFSRQGESFNISLDPSVILGILIQSISTVEPYLDGVTIPMELSDLNSTTYANQLLLKLFMAQLFTVTQDDLKEIVELITTEETPIDALEASPVHLSPEDLQFRKNVVSFMNTDYYKNLDVDSQSILGEMRCSPKFASHQVLDCKLKDLYKGTSKGEATTQFDRYTRAIADNLNFYYQTPHNEEYFRSLQQLVSEIEELSPSSAEKEDDIAVLITALETLASDYQAPNSLTSPTINSEEVDKMMEVSEQKHQRDIELLKQKLAEKEQKLAEKLEEQSIREAVVLEATERRERSEGKLKAQTAELESLRAQTAELESLRAELATREAQVPNPMPSAELEASKLLEVSRAQAKALEAQLALKTFNQAEYDEKVTELEQAQAALAESKAELEQLKTEAASSAELEAQLQQIKAAMSRGAKVSAVQGKGK